ncbi:UNVERIFIED_CONTAM: hypothetical protein HDU68_002841, partial [Siphonaria sp. JEL0065]
MTTNSIWYALGSNLAINTIGYVISAAKQTEKYYDLCGTSSFVASSFVALGSHESLLTLHARHVALLLTTSVWALRLLVHLWTRVHRLGGDSRFDGVKTKPLVFAIYWLVQALWVAVVSMPTVVVLAHPSQVLPPLNMFDFLGLAVWAAGFTLEVVADQQKA